MKITKLKISQKQTQYSCLTPFKPEFTIVIFIHY